MEIYLIRHTVPAIKKGVCYGQSDLDISNTFENESTQILNSIQFDSTTKIYSSPLKRCVKLAQKFSNNITIDDRLMEINFGDWELKKWDDIPRKESDSWMQDFVNVSTPNGEAYKDLSKRANQVFLEITKNETPKIIIVTHAGVIRSIVSKINDIPLSKSFDLKIEYGQIFKIKKTNSIFKIIT